MRRHARPRPQPPHDREIEPGPGPFDDPRTHISIGACHEQPARCRSTDSEREARHSRQQAVVMPQRLDFGTTPFDPLPNRIARGIPTLDIGPPSRPAYVFEPKLIKHVIHRVH